jgi:hypothetical protein
MMQQGQRHLFVCYDLESKPIVDDTLGIKDMRISFVRRQQRGQHD